MNPVSISFRSYAVIPAAGRSTRMGQPKLLLPWREATLIEAQLMAWRASPVSAVVMVVHPEDARLAQICRAAGAEVVVPASAPEEMKVSVNYALQHLRGRYSPADNDAWLLAPADMPLLSTPLIEQMLAAYHPNAPQIIVPVSSGRRGHPVLFPWRLAAEVPRLGSAEGLNALPARHSTRQLEIADEGMLLDVDTPADYQRLRGMDQPSTADRDLPSG